MILPQATPVPDVIQGGSSTGTLCTPDRDCVSMRMIPPQWSAGGTLRAYQEHTLSDRPTLAYGHLPQPGMLLRSDATAKRGVWYVRAVAPDGTTMEVVRVPRDPMEAARAAAYYYHTTSAVDDAWQLEYAPASPHP